MLANSGEWWANVLGITVSDGVFRDGAAAFARRRFRVV